MRWKWSNVPIPESHLAGLIAGIILQSVFPLHINLQPWLRHLLGWSAIASRLFLVGWSVTVVANMDITSPTRIVASGPYAISRKPMYVGWTLLCLGISLTASNLWILLLLPLVLIYTHRFVIMREENYLLANFGEQYQRYKDEVPRYL
jgi:protein-S-isoprenylcysteine O-methyltransferase Ste14